MKLSLLKKIFISAVALSFMAVGQVSAQPAPNPVVKNKNFGFSPNPKKKTETTASTTSPTGGEASKVIEISKNVNPADAVQKTSDVEAVAIQKADGESSESGSPPNENVENRSAASKTLEVAKKANAVAPTDIYKIGNSDVLFISLQNAPAKESNYFTVLNNGAIDYPLAGEMVQVTGLTVEQIEDLLKSKIKLYENPQVSVKVREHNSHTFTVLGLVEKAGEKTLTREALPLFVVRAEAVVQSKANRVTIKRANSEIQQIDLKDPKYGEVLIYPGDIVEFGFDDVSVAATTPKAQFYYIGGEIVAGGQKDFYQGLTLTQAILASGGLKKSTIRKVVIRRKNDAGLLTPTEYDLKAIKEGKVADPNLQIGDTIEIGN